MCVCVRVRLPACWGLQVVSKLVQIRESISKANSMRDDMLEKNDIPANVERLSHLIAHLKEQERSYLRFLQKMLVSFCFSFIFLGEQELPGCLYLGAGFVL